MPRNGIEMNKNIRRFWKFDDDIEMYEGRPTVCPDKVIWEKKKVTFSENGNEKDETIWLGVVETTGPTCW